MMLRRTLPLTLLMFVAACGSDAKGPTADVAGDTTATDSATGDTAATDSAVADTTAPDVAAADTTAADTTPGDTAPTETLQSDTATGDTTTAAVLDARCALSARIGVIELVSPSFGPDPHVSGWVQDGPDPWFGAPAFETAACAFHRAPTGCGTCADDEACGASGSCAKVPARRKDVMLTLSAGGQYQVVASDLEYGDLFAFISLAGDAFDLELAFGGHRVTLPATALPAPISDAVGALAGGYDAPTSLDITWTPVASGATLYTLIPMNHHVGGPTFTECAVPASSGALHVGEAMLAPLSVSTGLEFQGVHHMRFAAAETPYGCVEVRLSGGQQFIDVFE